MRVAIFANGELEAPRTINDLIQRADLIIAADGGARHCSALDVTPGAVIGDFDSLSSEDIESLKSQSVEIILHPAHKDYTDLELALRLASERQADEIFILGALGARYDQTLANLLLPTIDDFSDIKIILIHGPQEMQYIRGGQTVQIHGNIGETLSLIPLKGDVYGITTSGLEYPLVQESLLSGTTRGISNVFNEPLAMVQVLKGTLLCIHLRLDGGER